VILVLEKEINLIQNADIKSGVLQIVSKHQEWIRTYPTSISGKYHKHEPTMDIHLKRTVYFAKEFINEFSIKGLDADVLIAGCILHDIGLALLTRKGKVDKPNWKYYEVTGWSRRNDSKGDNHPILGSVEISKNPFPSSRRIQDLVESHMEHWNANCCRVSSDFLERLCALADYLASRENIVIKE